ncbi:hypothetical protein [Microcoleus sp. FACHB-68]|nr:hypothetical protein [Microcoleus sp. FACHB-68]MBD1936169.1 hypothetical protein [Microcoleus sp. FACHB-68]
MGIGDWALGMGHGAWGMGHWAWGMGQGFANLKVWARLRQPKGRGKAAPT